MGNQGALNSGYFQEGNIREEHIFFHLVFHKTFLFIFGEGDTPILIVAEAEQDGSIKP